MTYLLCRQVIAMKVTEMKQVQNLIGECSEHIAAATAFLSPSASPAAPAQRTPRVGVFAMLITSPYKSHLARIAKCLPFEVSRWSIFPHRNGWLLVAIVRATHETVKTFDFVGWAAQNGFRFNELAIWALSKTASLLSRISQRWFGRKTSSRQVMDFIKEFLREKVVKVTTLVLLIFLLHFSQGFSVSTQSKEVDAFTRISPARWIAPATLAPSAPPALPPAGR